MNHLTTLSLCRWCLFLLTFCLTWQVSQAAETNPTAVTSLIDRIGGSGASSRFVTLVDASLSADGNDIFVLTSQDGKPCIKGNSVSAVTTGLNWYLNHVAHINLAWNNLTTDLTTATLPLPASEEIHRCQADYRYYLNYCTFSYSMSTWTWERWQQEIDWMALHGINMPLQIVGLDVVWYKLLTEDYGYTSDEAGKFIAGPCFQAWWGMNNLEGWGGPNPDRWYVRQEALAKKILARQRELGMQPVLPGYSGMVPSDFSSKTGNSANNQGEWCYFLRPYILNPNAQAFTDVADKYYKRLSEVMGISMYYSMDPFHEGANTSGIDVAAAYSRIAQAMTKANAEAKWVIQYWQWSSDQYHVLSSVDKGKLIVLDLFSDAHTHFGEYQGHDAVYCILPNFGGRTGLFGRLTKVLTDYYKQRDQYSNVKGVGATPEAIEQVPVLYDALFELPWRTTPPDPKTWMSEYATSRYGLADENAQIAWEKLRNSALNCETGLQGPHEAVLCARPALQVGSVSTWGGTGIFYDAQEVADAAYRLLMARERLSNDNYSYDLTDVTRQALTDYAYYLLKAINDAHGSGNKSAYAARRDAYLQLMLDIDELLSTNKNFMLGRWTQMARSVADEMENAGESDRQWLELENARTLITTWGAREQSEYGGLRDYSYREWAGMIKDFYYPRWKTFFENLDNNSSQPDWFEHDWNWAHNASLQYSDQPVGETAEVAARVWSNYFVDFTPNAGTYYHAYRHIDNDATNIIQVTADRGTSYTLPLSTLPAGVTAKVGADFNNDGMIADDETTEGVTLTIPATAVTGRVNATLTLSDGTVLTFRLMLKDKITTPRTVTVKTSDETQGTVSIEGSEDLAITNTAEVTVKATAASGYDFVSWTDAQGTVVSRDNPYTYYGAAAADFTANFIVNKWGSPEEDLSEHSVIDEYGQYLTTIGTIQNGGEEKEIYSTPACPDRLFQTTQTVTAARGSKLSVHWKDKGGMNYCRLSAYIDLNSDGDFDDTDELLTVLGNKESAGNTVLNEHTLDILLPYDIPEGITHIRLRFDGAWQGGQDSKTDAMPADNKTLRMVYDIPLDITSLASTACTVTVKSADEALGTVDANGQPATYTYKIGEEVVLRCYPATGYALLKWTDQYGRTVPKEWTDGNFLRFHAPESNTYTAHFTRIKGETLTLGNWKFNYTIDEAGQDLTLTQAVSGEGALNIPATYDGMTIRAIAAGALQGQTKLTSLTLPTTITDLGTNILMKDAFQGSNVQDATIPLEETLKGDTTWQIHLDVATDGSSFNQWGSSLLATGATALNDSYDRGFQLYLKADGSIVVKLGYSEVKTFDITNGISAFSIDIAHDAAGSLHFTVTTPQASDTYEQVDYALDDITILSTALPHGIGLTSIVITDPSIDTAPLRGCTALSSLTVAEGNKSFQSVDNLLLSADGHTLLACPEGLQQASLTLPASVTTIASHAFTSVPGLRCLRTENSTPAVAEDNAFETKTLYAAVPLPDVTSYRTAWGLPILFSIKAGTTMSNETADLVTDKDAIELCADDQATGAAPVLNIQVPIWLTRSFDPNRLYPICLPTPPEGLSVEGIPTGQADWSMLKLYHYVDGRFAAATDEAKAGSYLLTVPEQWKGKTVTLRLPHTATSTVLPLNGFTGNGTTFPIAVSQPLYTYDPETNEFVYRESESVSPQTLAPLTATLTAYDGCPEVIPGPKLTTGITSPITTDKASMSVTIFDLQGRRVTQTTRGIYIINGQKKLIR